MIVPRGKGGKIRLALNYLSYAFFASAKAFQLGLTKKFDTVIVHEPSPILVGIPAIIVKRLQKIKVHFWVLDLWPESLSAAGGFKDGPVLKFFNAVTRWIYKNCDSLLIGSKGFRQSINEKGNFDDKISYFPNWVEDSLKSPVEQTTCPTLPAGFNVVIAGNMGEAQDIPHILNAAKQLQDTRINFVFVGDGRKKEYAESFIKENHMDHVFMIGRYPLDTMPRIFAQADLLLMALKPSSIFALTVPSRLQAYMSSGKPVIAMLDGEGANLINESQCGWCVNAGKDTELANAIRHIASLPSEELRKRGENGRNYSERHFNFSDCIDNLERIIGYK